MKRFLFAILFGLQLMAHAESSVESFNITCGRVFPNINDFLNIRVVMNENEKVLEIYRWNGFEDLQFEEMIVDPEITSTDKAYFIYGITESRMLFHFFMLKSKSGGREPSKSYISLKGTKIHHQEVINCFELSEQKPNP